MVREAPWYVVLWKRAGDKETQEACVLATVLLLRDSTTTKKFLEESI